MEMYLCRYKNCEHTVSSKGSYCKEHQENNVRPAFASAHKSSPLYNTRQWKKLKSQIINEQESCAICGSTEGLVVHHIQPHRGDLDLFFTPTNLIVLCKYHHDLITNQEIASRKKCNTPKRSEK